ncbi:NPCBM/NEW2 domain-containing protein, partial [Deinococcus budaensis]
MNDTSNWKGRAKRLAPAILVLSAALAACSKAPAPDAGKDPYAGGVSYPWSDRVGPAGDDPYAGGVSYPWTGAGAPTALRGAQGSAQTFLSDTQWTSATNAWGPVERDRSNGEQGAADGRPLTLGGQTFAKGLGVHAPSEISYALSGQCTTFTATLGLDDEVGDRGSVVFEVWNGTATKLFDSGLLRGADAPRAISVPIDGVSSLRLVVRDAGDGLNYDHADW